ncbi:hypothetical protein ABW20_dc0106818 [Dactylellina cionopaga]|nr:hypothetical protein ABW20_dc0106818 [Dactylellina cionopaga]
MEVLGAVSSAVALVEVAGKIGLLCAKYITDVRGAKADAVRITKEVQIFAGLLKDISNILDGPFGFKLKASQSLKDAIGESEKVLESLKTDLERGLEGDGKLKQTNFLKRVVGGLNSEDLKWPFKKKDVETIVRNLRALQSTVTLALQIDNLSIVALKDLKANLEKLPVAKEAMFGSAEDQHEPQCLPQTRVEVLEGIERWATGPRERHIFWLRGMAGTGKSTIARTVARHLEGNGWLGASFFFKRSQNQRSNASRFFPTLAYGLMQHIPSLVPHMNAAIETNPDVCTRSFKDQFEKLLLEPLSQMDCVSTAAVVVVDALDECQNEQEILLLLGFLGQLSKLGTVDLRVFITSRPDFAPLAGFKKLTRDDTHHHDLALHDVDRETVRRDIRLYLEHEFARIQSDRADDVPENWPKEGDIQQLVHIAEPLFISAATICRFVDDKNFPPAKRLDTILTAGYKAPGVYQIYLTVFEQILAGLDSTSADRETILAETQKIISTIVMLESPLSRQSLSELIGIDEETIHYRLRPFHSILVVPVDPDLSIKTFHLSFRDFLLDPRQKSKNPFSVDEREVHRAIAKECIALLSRKLMMNICGLRSPGAPTSEIDPGVIQRSIPPDLRYACQHWVHHLQKSQDEIRDDGPVHEFLQEHLLHWLEATSILGIASKNVHLVKALQKMVSNCNRAGKLPEFLWDLDRFVTFNQSIVAHAPLQVYFSGLLFAPEDSIVRTTFAPKYLCWVRRAPKVPKIWGPLMQTLEGHSDFVTSVAFSPDSKQLASSSSDTTVKLWDTVSGTLLQTLENCSNLFTSVSFSPDGKQLTTSILTEWQTVGVSVERFNG